MMRWPAEPLKDHCIPYAETTHELLSEYCKSVDLLLEMADGWTKDKLARSECNTGKQRCQ